ncbi:hypothetical protein JOC78_003464, partial [Bacillus ectoiniformans]|uniref:hypothetical protein n=1 Tax=Bacillus ectoiniformans TaxID=1494429 RepID=UPI00195B0555
MEINTFQLKVLVERWLKDNKKLLLRYSQPVVNTKDVSIGINFHPTAVTLLPSSLAFQVNGGTIEINFFEIDYEWMGKMLMTPDNDQKLTAHFVLNLTGFLPFKDREALK